MASSLVRLDTIQAPPEGHMGLTLVGTGASTGVPVIGHVQMTCACADAIANPTGRNRRNHVSLLITIPLDNQGDVECHTFTEEGDGSGCLSHARLTDATHNSIHGTPVSCTLVGCGTTFREAYFNVLAGHHLQLVDALLVTDSHADALAGIDDLRDLQRMRMRDGGQWSVENFIPAFAHAQTLGVLRQNYGYIMRNSHVLGTAPPTAESYKLLMGAHVAQLIAENGEDNWSTIGIRRSAAFHWFELPSSVPAPIHVPALGPSMPVYSLPVEHGKDYISLGFVFGTGTAFKSTGASRESVAGKSCVVYILHLSTLIEPSKSFLLGLVKIDVLITDCCMGPGCFNPTHMCMEEMVELVALLKPRHAFGVGMYCDVEYAEGSAWLAQQLARLEAEGRLVPGEVLSIELGYDGLEFFLPQ